ncbi:hypothetical protein [Pseudomonas oryzihabitans]|uniref:hypothetical protein n=1 Tax=Pseudomonas oryzihabitans TaxID=47885 RepID=UPI0011A977CD|nr:hypothetical protein [Pseudomonas psychrotolerans]
MMPAPAAAFDPLELFDDAFLAACFPGALAVAEARVLRQARWCTEAAAVIAEIHDLPAWAGGALASGDIALLRSGAAGLQRVALRCGAVRQASALNAEVRGEYRRVFEAELGADALGFARRHPAPPDARPPLPATRVIEAVRTEGAACLDAWLASLPPPVMAWVRLGLALPVAGAQDGDAELFRRLGEEGGDV